MILLNIFLYLTSIYSHTLLDRIESNPNLTTFLEVIELIGINTTLSNTSTYTIVAPSNDAFNKLPSETFEHLLYPENKWLLEDIVNYHLISGTIYKKCLLDNERLKTLQGEYLDIHKKNQSIYFNNAKLITSDINASNGVLHIIDTLLDPYNNIL